MHDDGPGTGSDGSGTSSSRAHVDPTRSGGRTTWVASLRWLRGSRSTPMSLRPSRRGFFVARGATHAGPRCMSGPLSAAGQSRPARRRPGPLVPHRRMDLDSSAMANRIVLAGGTGQVGALLRRRAIARGDEVIVLTRHPKESWEIGWDGRTLGAWAAAISGASAVVNLAGRTVNCRYTKKNLAEMMSSRVDSTGVIGEAIARATSLESMTRTSATPSTSSSRAKTSTGRSTSLHPRHSPTAPS